MNKDNEYTPPNKASARNQRAELNAQIQAFLNGGGSIEAVENDIESTEASQKIKAKHDAARKRGLEKIRGAA
jgi:hypothetical protein